MLVVFADSREQRATVKFCFLLEKIAIEALGMLKTRLHGWCNVSSFPDSKSVKRLTNPKNVHLKNVHEVILKVRRRTIKEVIKLSGVIWSSVQRIVMNNLAMNRVTAKFVHQMFTTEQKHAWKQALLG